MVEVIGVFVPIVMFIAIAAVLCVYIYYRHRNRQAVQETVRTAIEQGQELTPEILERLGQPPKAEENSDLRRGVILVAVGVGCAVLGVMLGKVPAEIGIGVGTAVLVIGMAYVGLWAFGRRK